MGDIDQINVVGKAIVLTIAYTTRGTNKNNIFFQFVLTQTLATLDYKIRLLADSCV